MLVTESALAKKKRVRRNEVERLPPFERFSDGNAVDFQEQN